MAFDLSLCGLSPRLWIAEDQVHFPPLGAEVGGEKSQSGSLKIHFRRALPDDTVLQMLRQSGAMQSRARGLPDHQASLIHPQPKAQVFQRLCGRSRRLLTQPGEHKAALV